jgi:hypothetical protein
MPQFIQSAVQLLSFGPRSALVDGQAERNNEFLNAFVSSPPTQGECGRYVGGKNLLPEEMIVNIDHS